MVTADSKFESFVSELIYVHIVKGSTLKTYIDGVDKTREHNGSVLLN